MSAYDTIRNNYLGFLYETENSLNLDTSDEAWSSLSPEYLLEADLRNTDVRIISTNL